MEMTVDKVKAAIVAGEISAISLDTSTFSANNDRLEHGVLALLSQFRGTPIRFILSDVVVGEVKGHILRDAKDAESKVKASLRSVGLTWQVPGERREAALNALVGQETAQEMTNRRWADFAGATGLSVIESSRYVNIDRILSSYFASEPPFGTNPAKKAEFPDALALHSLEGWAKERGTKVLVVSGDGDWIKYCKASESLIAVKDLGEALSYFHASAEVLCKLLSQRVANGQLELLDEVGAAATRSLDQASFVPEANAAYHFDTDVYDVSIEKIQLLTQGGDGLLFKPVSQGDGYLIVEAIAVATVKVSCSFEFSVTDSIDRDEVPIGSASLSQDVAVELRVLVTFEGDMTSSPEVADVEVELESDDIWVDFGEVEPDWRDDDD